jgi:hypothetical protein
MTGPMTGSGFLGPQMQPSMMPQMQPGMMPQMQPGMMQPMQPGMMQQRQPGMTPQQAPRAIGSSPKPGGLTAFKNPAPNYKFVGAEDSLQAIISASHVGVVLLGTACLLGGCIGMALAGGRAESDDEEDDK